VACKDNITCKRNQSKGPQRKTRAGNDPTKEKEIITKEVKKTGAGNDRQRGALSSVAASVAGAKAVALVCVFVFSSRTVDFFVLLIINPSPSLSPTAGIMPRRSDAPDDRRRCYGLWWWLWWWRWWWWWSGCLCLDLDRSMLHDDGSPNEGGGPRACRQPPVQVGGWVGLALLGVLVVGLRVCGWVETSRFDPIAS
jgi:hypothetical protein